MAKATLAGAGWVRAGCLLWESACPPGRDRGLVTPRARGCGKGARLFGVMLKTNCLSPMLVGRPSFVSLCP